MDESSSEVSDPGESFFAQTIVKQVIKRPWFVIFGFILITAILSLFIPRIHFKTSVYDLIIKDLPETTRYNEFKQQFGSEEIIRVVIKCENVFDEMTFEHIGKIAEQAAGIDGVRRVISLPGIKSTVEGAGNWELGKFKSLIANVALIDRNLLSTDGLTTAITLVLSNDARHDHVIQEVNTIITSAAKGLSLYQIKMPLVSQALAQLTEQDFFRLPPITFILIALVLICIFRNVRYVLIPLLCVSMALAWAFGLASIFLIPLSMLTMIVPVFLIAVGTAYCLHIVAEHISKVRHADNRTNAALET